MSSPGSGRPVARHRVTVPLEGATGVAAAGVEAAGAVHADVAEREIEAHWVCGIDLPERRGHLRGHLPARAREARQA